MTVNPWALDDPESNRQRYVKADVRRGQTDTISARIDSFHIRRLDEILAGRFDATFKTRSDILQDAISMWLDDWDRRFPDGAGGTLSYMARLEALQRKRQQREDFIESAERQMTGLRQDSDLDGISEYLQTMLQAFGNFKDDAPPAFLSKIDNLIDQAKRLLAAAQ